MILLKKKSKILIRITVKNIGDFTFPHLLISFNTDKGIANNLFMAPNVTHLCLDRASTANP